MGAFLAIGLIGTALSAYGNYKSAQAQGEAKRQQSELDRMKGLEVLRRNEINTELLGKEAIKFSGKQTAQIAASGGGFTASSVALLEETARTVAEEMGRNLEEAEWEAHMISLGAESRDVAAGEIEKAGKISAVGSILGGGIGLARATQGV